MTYDEYVKAHQRIVAPLVLRLIALLNPFRSSRLGSGRWIGLLAAMYRIVFAARMESARLAREFYDSERERHLPDEPRHDLYLADYDPDWFYEAMEPARETFSEPDASDEAMAHVIQIAVKETENGGRKTILRAVDTDPKVIGWARVQGGSESCGFCMMLISRGPVYKQARDAGLNADQVSAVEIWKQYDRSGDDSKLMELMTRWHKNCDCKVVPVFDRANWPGRDQYLAAEKLWAEVTGPYTGRDKLRAFRRFIEAGRTSGRDSSFVPAA